MASLITATGGLNGMVFNQAGLLVPQVAPAYEFDPVTRAPLGMRLRGNPPTAMAWPSRPTPPPDNTYFTAVDAPGIVSGQLARKYTRVSSGTPPMATFTGGAATVGTGQTLTQWAIVERDPASATSLLQLHWYRTSGTPGPVAYFTLDLATGAISSILAPAGTTYRAQLLQDVGPNGGKVWLMRLSTVMPAGDTLQPYLYIQTNVGDSIFIHHRQLQAGSEIGERPLPVVTTTAAATRTYDAIAINNLHAVPWFNPAEFTMMVDFTPVTPAVINGSGILSIGKHATGTFVDRVAIYLGSTGGMGFQVSADGVTNANISTGAALVSGAKTRAVVSIKKGGNMIASVNGAPANSVACTMPDLSGAARMTIGSLLGSAGYLYDGYINGISFWPKAANATEIRNLTLTTREIVGY